MPQQRSSIEYRLYRASDAAEAATLLANVFPRHDPLAWAVGLTAREFELFLNTLLPPAAEEKLTMVARIAGTGELAGVMLTNDPARETAAGMETLSEKFAPVANLLGKLGSTYRTIKDPKPGEVLHLYLLGVSNAAAGKGVAQQLVAETVENGARKGYKIAVAEATNPASQHIFLKLGFAVRGQIAYRDFLFQGRRIFASIAEYGGPMLMEKELDPSKRASPAISG